MLEQSLIDYGLTRNESKVYLALLKLGSATVVEITQSSGVHRVNVYDVLERLREKGLISMILQSNKRIYEAASPEQLINLVQQKEELINKIMPQLKDQYTMVSFKQQVHNFFGPEGVMRAYYMMLEQKRTLYALGGSGLNRKYLMHRHEMWNKERIKRKIKARGLYYEFTRSKKKDRWSDPSFTVKYMPNKFKTVGMVDVCGDLIVNLIPLEGNIMAIVVENKVLAETYRQFFHFMWSFAKD